MFRDCLSSHGQSVVESISGDVTKNIFEDAPVHLDSWVELTGNGEKGDAASKNLEGDNEAISLAARWMTPGEHGMKKLQKIQGYLPESLKVRLGKVISEVEVRVQALAEERVREESQARSERSEETDEDRYDDRGKTAHRIFAGSSFTSSERSPSAPVEEEAGFYTPVSSPSRTQNRQRLLTVSPTPPSNIFNQEYADWFTPITPTKERLNPFPETPEPKKTMNVLTPSTNKVNGVYRSTTSKSYGLNSTSQPLLPSATPSSASAPFTSTFSSSSTKRSSKTPPSPSAIARRDKRRAEREERRRITLKLGRARPDLVSKEFTESLSTSTQEEQS